jgi:exopolysaccharide biosynthesis polyprenyl glycosylphosphotransferase
MFAPMMLEAAFGRALGAIAGLVAASLAQFWIPSLELTGSQLLTVAAFVFCSLVLVDTLARGSKPRQQVVVVGRGAGAEGLVREVSADCESPFEIVAMVVEDAGVDVDVPVRTLRQLGSVVTEFRPDVVVLADEETTAAALPDLLDAASAGFRIMPLHHFHEHAFGRVPLTDLSPRWFMSVLHMYQRPYPRFAKRCLDLTIVALVLPFALLMLPIIAILVRLSGPGPILFRQVRLGEFGKPFNMLKFRSMVDGAEGEGGAVWAREHDPRITQVGRVIRRLRLDELPQLWNVIRGDMRVVGPRPERPEFVAQLREEVPYWTRRHLVKPGVTGWAQVRHAYTSDSVGAAEKLTYDLYYLKHCSLGLDLAILARTAAVVVSGFGSR